LSERSDERRVALSGGIDGVPRAAFALFRARLLRLVEDLVDAERPEPFRLVVDYGQDKPGLLPADQTRDETTSVSFVARDPEFSLDQLALPQETLDRLLDCASLVAVSPVVFDDWGLRSIEPHPSAAVNFRGPPGTGKTMAAHAVASYLGRRLMQGRVSDLESRYVGAGPKNIARLFTLAAEQDAVLFIDEAESLLSKRFSQPEQAAESAINSMRAELLMALDSYQGLVIFASNLPHSYDPAMESRLMHVDFGLPDYELRRRIWQIHLRPQLPLGPDVQIDELAEVSGVTGRDIKQAVIDAAVEAARRGNDRVAADRLLQAIRRHQEPSL
jgi:ATP-dependent 26S proteasome regulatory subunit